MTKIYKIISLLALTGVKADVPASCRMDQIAGFTWNFHVSQEQSTINLYQTTEVCTHRLPNLHQYITPDHDWKFQKDDIWKIQANKDATALATFCKNGDLTKCDSEKTVDGKWKLVEAQGLIFNLDNGIDLIAHLVYYLPKKVPLMATPKTTNCDRTMMGFVINSETKDKGTMKEHPVQCMFGIRQPNEEQKNSLVEAKPAAKEAQYAIEDDIDMNNLKPDNNAGRKKSQVSLTKKLSEILKEQHKDRHSGTKDFNKKTPEFKEALEKAQKWRKQYTSNSLLQQESLPDQWDWRNIDGYDFTGKLMDQGPCGSCYTISQVQAVNSILKIKYGEREYIPSISVDQILSCNYMNEACSGGQSIYNSYYLMNAEFVDEKCAPYSLEYGTKRGGCQRYKDCPSLGRVTKAYYLDTKLGKFAPDEYDIQRELLRRGPVMVSINAGDVEAFYHSNVGDANETLESIKNEDKTTVNFSLYKDGIMKQDLIREPKIAIAQQESEHEDIIIPEEGGSILIQIDASQVMNQDHDHSVLIVGWGTDKKNQIPYWILRNSYGDHWGMHGDFYIRRGMNDFAVESEGQGFDIELY